MHLNISAALTFAAFAALASCKDLPSNLGKAFAENGLPGYLSGSEAEEAFEVDYQVIDAIPEQIKDSKREIRQTKVFLNGDAESFEFGSYGTEVGTQFVVQGAERIKVEIVDGYALGDAFVVYANNKKVAVTAVPEVTVGVSRETYEEAVGDLRYSSAQFITGPAKVRIFSRASPYGAGTAFFQAEEVLTCNTVVNGFFVVQTPFFWYNAASACESYNGAKLAEIPSRKDGKKALAMLEHCLEEGSRTVWIGSYKKASGVPLTLQSIRNKKKKSSGRALEDRNSRSLPVLCQLA